MTRCTTGAGTPGDSCACTTHHATPPHLNKDLDERDCDTNEEPDFHGHKDDAKEGANRREEIHLVSLPRGNGTREVYLLKAR